MEREGKHVLSHAGIYLIARGVPGVMAFVAIPLFSRLLTKEQYGQYALVIATVGLLNSLVFEWLRLSLVRYLPVYRENPERLQSVLATTAALLIMASGIVAGTIFLLPIHSAWRAMAIPCWIALAVQALFDLASQYSRAVLRPWQFMVLALARSTAMVVVGAALIKMGAGWWGPLAGVTAGMALATIYAYRRDWKGVKFTIERETLAKICQYGIPLSVTVALAAVISSSDRFLIAGYLGEGAAGLYSVAVDFTAQTLTLLMMVINLAMYPIAVRAYEQHGKEAAQEQMRSNASLLMAVAIPCVIGLTVLAPGISYCFLGKDFRTGAAAIMPLVALGTFLAGMKAYHFDAAFQFAHRTIFQVWIVLFAAAVNVVLNVIAIPRWGINGAACASVLAYIVSIVLTAYLGRKHFVLPFPMRAGGQVVLAGAIMAAALVPFRGALDKKDVAMQIAGGGALYCLSLFAMNFLELRDIAIRKWRSSGMAAGHGFPVLAPVAAAQEGGEAQPLQVLRGTSLVETR